jgi:acetyl esterase/lipase
VRLLLISTLLALGMPACTGQPANVQPAATRPVRETGIEAYSAVQVTRDVTYTQPDNIAHMLDIYQPKPLPEDRLLPVVIYLHGGGWRSGDKQKGPSAAYADALARRGFVVVCANYRLSGKPDNAKFPAQLTDAEGVVEWIRDHARDYGGDASRAGAFGTSAGAHLAALLGVHHEVNAVADWYGPADLRSSAGWPRDSRGMIRQLLGAEPEAVPEQAIAASPIALINETAPPPFLIVHGEKDGTVPIEQSRKLHDALMNAGGNVESIEVPGGGHGEFGRAWTDRLIERTASFFHEKL